MIYLDNSATTKPCKEAVEAVMDAMTENWANPSSLYHFGMEGARLMRSAMTAFSQTEHIECCIPNHSVLLGSE